MAVFLLYFDRQLLNRVILGRFLIVFVSVVKLPEHYRVWSHVYP